ncbi:hypothetical protein JCM5353_002195 [Sporobolomyces roseus]
MSIVVPFLPATVGYKYARPVVAWTLTCTNKSQKHRDLWSSRVENEQALNVGYNPELPNSLAFPRFLHYRQVTERAKMAQMINKGEMEAFRKDEYRVTMRTDNLDGLSFRVVRTSIVTVDPMIREIPWDN